MSIALALGGMATAPAPADAAVFTWTGSPAVPGSTWSVRQFVYSNWSFTGILPTDVDSLVFDGGNKLVNENDLLNTVTDLSFAAGAGAFTINGRALGVQGTLRNDSTRLQVINAQLAAQAPTALWSGGAGGIDLRGGLLLGNRTLELSNNMAVSGGGMVVGSGGKASLTLSNHSTLASSTGVLGSDSWSDQGIVTVQSGNSAWSVAGALQVGKAGQGLLSVLQGGTVSAGSMVMGDAATAVGTVNVLGTDALLRANAVVGNRGIGVLNIRSGGRAVGNLTVASEVGSKGTVLVDGGALLEGGVLLGSGTIDVSVRSGGRIVGGLTAASAVPGRASVLVDGQGSTLDGNVHLGLYGSVGTLAVTNGAQVLTSELSVNSAPSTVTITGSGSRLDATRPGREGGALLELRQGEFNVLSGGSVSSIQVLGNNRMLVDGAGSNWNNAGDLFVGFSGDQGQLQIRNRGRVASAVGWVGGWIGEPVYLYPLGAVYPTSLGTGVATVSGTGSQWDSTRLVVGAMGEGTLNIVQGGAVSTGAVSVGDYGFTKDGDTTRTIGRILVDGVQSRLYLSSSMTLGRDGSGSLVISNQGQVKLNSLNASSGLGISDVTVDGAGSSLTGVDGEFTSRFQMAGGRGSVSTMRILNGAQASSSIGTVGWDGTASVLVDGAGSRLSFSQGLTVAGQAGSGTVEVRRGAQLTSASVEIGRFGYAGPGPAAYSTGRVTIEGAGSVFTVGGDVHVGPAGNGTLQLFYGGRLSAGGTLAVGSRGVVQIAGGSLASQAISLAGGRIDSPTALDLRTAGPLTGFGAVNGRITAGSQRITASGGTLMLGDTAVAGAVTLGGVLDVGQEQVVLRSADAVVLGSSTMIGAGGRLTAANGLVLGSGSSLLASGGARLEADLVNDGHVGSANGVLRLAGTVRGAGSFAGSVQFDAAHQPGSSPARIDFGGGNVSYAPGAVLTMELFGPAAGSQYDQLAHIDLLSFSGRLQLVVDDEFMPAAGSRFQLFDFRSFSGVLDAGQIDVAGFDRTRLDFSRLSVDGSLGIAAAVPEPHGYALLLAGLAFVAVRARRARADG